MPPSKTSPKSLVEAVQQVFEALEPFDEPARQRILSSAMSLLGGALSSSVGRAVDQNPSRALAAQPLRPVSERPRSPIELIQEKKPATHAQRIALFAYYREKVEGLSRFTKEDLRSYFAKARQHPPQNFDRDYRHAVKLGWIYDDADDSYLTSKGLEAVEAGFGGKALPRGIAASKGVRRGRAQRRQRGKR